MLVRLQLFLDRSADTCAAAEKYGHGRLPSCCGAHDSPENPALARSSRCARRSRRPILSPSNPPSATSSLSRLPSRYPCRHGARARHWQVRLPERRVSHPAHTLTHAIAARPSTGRRRSAASTFGWSSSPGSSSKFSQHLTW